jgi:deoxyribonuclease (pyrimidine dimer)
MTRINLVDQSALTNKHLMAEYKELPRIFTAVRKLYASGKTIADVKDIPSEYVLGAGHCKFFYNKLDWLICRYVMIKNELDSRGYNLDLEKFQKIHLDAIDLILDLEGGLIEDLTIEYNPTPEEIYKNMYRIAVRHFGIKDEVFE